MLPLLLAAAAAPKLKTAAAAAVTSSAAAAAARVFLHRHHGPANPILRAVAPKDPWLQTDGVVRETALPVRLAVGGVAGANAAALDPALAAGAPSRPGWRAPTHDAPATGQQKMATEQDVIAADEGTSTAEFLPQRTP
jgi:hypothetical protein